MARILFVDDEPLIREEAVQLLRRDGHQVVQAEDGREALRLLETLPIDIVVLDIVMPKQDGLETIARIRGLEDEAREVKILTISNGGGGRGDRGAYLKWSKAMGSDGVLPKPFCLAELRAAIEALAGGAAGPGA